MTIEIKEVTTKKELKKFINFGIDLFKGNPYFCPPLIFDEINSFDKKKNPAHEISDHIIYLAYQKGEIVGRIVGIINHKANEKWENKRLRFGWIDFIDDLNVSKALFEAVQIWGKAHGMNEMNGPVGFTDFDHQGLLIEGFDYSSPMASLYNYPYYEQHFEAFGLQKEIDWIEYRLTMPDEVPPRMKRLAKVVMEKSKLEIHKIKSIKELKKYYPNNEYLDVVDQAYQSLYNYQPLTDKQKTYYSNMYFPLLNFDFVTIVINEMKEIVGVGLGMPDISDALRKCKGKLFPLGWFHILKALKAKKNMEYFDMLLIAVRPDYQNKGINALFFYDTAKHFVKYGVKYAETTSILETNNKSQANFEEYDKIQHKRRRAYIKSIA